MRLAIAANALDLATFLVLAPLVVAFGVERSLGTAGAYVVGGALLVLAWKAAGLAVAFGLAASAAQRYEHVILVSAAVLGTVGAASNTVALWQLRSLFGGA